MSVLMRELQLGTYSPATRQSCSVDVIIVGAGLSGLQAARLVQEAGLTCIVLEAIGRVGGKTRTVRSAETNSGFKDIGAAWLNDTSQSNMFALMKELKLTAVVQRAEGKDVMLSKDGQVELVPHGDSSPVCRICIPQRLATKTLLCWRLYIESPSAAEKARKLDHLTVADFGEEISGALFFINYCKAGTGLSRLLSDEKDGAQCIRIREGISHCKNTIVFKRHFSKLSPSSVLLSAPEKSIHQHKGGDCEVKSTTGLGFRCKKVVVSISTCLYPMIEFDPPLPQAKKDLSESTTRDAGLSGSFVSDHIGPTTFAFDTCVEQDEQWSISCFVVGKPGLEWSTLPMAVRRKKVLDRLKYAFGKVVGNVPDPINTIEMEWSKNEEPVGNVQFVGTETSDMWRGYMEGAVRSGIGGAEEVIEALQGQKKRSVASL
ncbi:flavin-containing amine oxidase [Phyllosticta citricarpa]